MVSVGLLSSNILLLYSDSEHFVCCTASCYHCITLHRIKQRADKECASLTRSKICWDLVVDFYALFLCFEQSCFEFLISDDRPLQ